LLWRTWSMRGHYCRAADCLHQANALSLTADAVGGAARV